MAFAETSYAVGSVEQVREGLLSRRRLVRDIDFSELISSRQRGEQIVGVYQKTWPRRPSSSEEADIVQKFLKRQIQVLELFLEERMLLILF
jgi:hypothetical protein